MAGGGVIICSAVVAVVGGDRGLDRLYITLEVGGNRGLDRSYITCDLLTLFCRDMVT